MDKTFNLRHNRKTVFYGLIVVWLVSVNLWLYGYKSVGFAASEASIYDHEYGTPTTISAQPSSVNVDVFHDTTIKNMAQAVGIKDTRSIDAHSSVYDSLLAKHQLSDILTNLDFTERCDLYFKNLFGQNRNWFVNPSEDLPLDHRHEFDYESFKHNVYDGMKEKYAEGSHKKVDDVDYNDKKVAKAVESLVKAEYKQFWDKTMGIEQKMVDYLSHLRIFNKCYITNDNKYIMDKANKLLTKEATKIDHSKFQADSAEKLINHKSFGSCSELESRIYKWISFSYPIYERWTGDIFLTPPNMRDFVKYPEVFKPTTPKFNELTDDVTKSTLTGNKPCFFNNFKNKLNGKGIVLSIKDSHVDDTVKLIHLLRALNNHYPIQIVFYDSINDESKIKIVNAARKKMIDLPASFNKVAKNFPPGYFNFQDGGLPKQEVWFVNTYNAIHNNYKDKFRGFANKFLATLFNSFEEVMLIDADTVLVQNPSYYFNLKNYVSKGAYFFKDRTAPEFRPTGDTKFFEKITPSILDNLMFDIPIISQKTLGLEFFQGMGHFMESGLVLINRNLHFNSVLTMVQLNFFNPVTTRVYGDKEIFWLGFATTGDEDYHFNKFFAASVGALTPQQDRLNGDGTEKKSQEVCSAHPGHINGEDGKTLIWFNSGFKFCGQSDVVKYEDEVKKQEHLKFLKDAQSMREYYEGPIVLKNAIIPPFKNKLETWAENIIEEPRQGWHMEKGYCNSYLWCAYSSIGGLTNDGGDTTQTGQVFDFDKDSIDLFKYYGDVWVGNE